MVSGYQSLRRPRKQINGFIMYLYVHYVHHSLTSILNIVELVSNFIVLQCYQSGLFTRSIDCVEPLMLWLRRTYVQLRKIHSIDCVEPWVLCLRRMYVLLRKNVCVHNESVVKSLEHKGDSRQMYCNGTMKSLSIVLICMDAA